MVRAPQNKEETFFIVCTTEKRKLLFQINGNEQLTVQLTRKNCKNIFNNIFRADIIYFSSRIFAVSTRTGNFRHLTSRTCDVAFGLEITSGFCPWLINVTRLSSL